MITRFGSLFAAYPAIENVGFDGKPVDDRHYSNEHLATAFDDTAKIAQLMDRTGYDVFWLAEHHFQSEGYECVPNIPLMAVHLSHLTKRIKFGSAFNIPPMWHPLRLAEDFATADILTGGRLIFGIGRGYHTREVEVLGAPLLDQEANRDLFEEQVEIIFKAFNEDSFSHHGKHYDIPAAVPYRGHEIKEITLVPRPMNLPVETWQPIVSGSQRGMDFMAKHGVKGLIGGGAAPGGASEKLVHQWRDTLARHGRDTVPGEDLLVSYYVWMADTPEQAMEEATPYFEEHTKMFAPLGMVPGLTDEQIRATADPQRVRSMGMPTVEDSVKAGAYICGPPETIIETLMEVQSRFPGLGEMILSYPIATPVETILKQLEWFARDVIPVFRAQVAESAPAD